MAMPKIAVLGIGGAGKNALAFLDQSVDLQAVAVDGDTPASDDVVVSNTLDGATLAIVVTGLGGMAGAESALRCCGMARDLGIPIYVFAVMPFYFEGMKRTRRSEAQLSALSAVADHTQALRNQELFEICDRKTVMTAALDVPWLLLRKQCARLSAGSLPAFGHGGPIGEDSIWRPEKLPLVWEQSLSQQERAAWQFAATKPASGVSKLAGSGKYLKGYRVISTAAGNGYGERRAIECADAALNTLKWSDAPSYCDAAIIRVMGRKDTSLFEVDEAINTIRDQLNIGAEIVVGTSFHNWKQDMCISLRFLTKSNQR